MNQYQDMNQGLLASGLESSCDYNLNFQLDSPWLQFTENIMATQILSQLINENSAYLFKS